MDAFTFNTVPRVVFAPGAARELAAHCRSLGLVRPLLVTDPGLVELGLVAPVEAALAADGLTVTRFAEVREDPPESVVLACVERGSARSRTTKGSP